MNYHVLLIGHLFPDNLAGKILDQEIRPVQTQRFGIALLDALKIGFNNKVDVLSAAPLLDYPHSRLLIAPSSKWNIDNSISATMIPYVNLVVLKHLTRFITTLVFVCLWIFKNRNHKRVIILHGVQSCKLWSVIFAQMLYPSIIVTYLTDNLGVPSPWENNILKKLRLIDVHFMRHGLQKISGVIAMTPKLAEKLAPGLPTLIMPTIQKLGRKPFPARKKNYKNNFFNIVYSGGLTRDYGINLLLAAFKEANRKNWHLLISGWGNLENRVRDFAADNSRVKYFGLLNEEDLFKLYRDADVFVNPKLSNTSFAEMAFPSKIVEYLATGKPVISTNLPVFDDNIKKHLILSRSDTSEELISCLDKVYSLSSNKLDSIRKDNLKFVNEKLSSNVQGARIRNFINEIKLS